MILISNQFLGTLKMIFDFDFKIKMSLVILILNLNHSYNDFTQHCSIVGYHSVPVVQVRAPSRRH